ncbi:FAD-dependent oxidoreductase [Acidovorax sp. NCPPB 3859]|nr:MULTISPECIES: FAD-dependent oxidoreductase [unclassified Acidovorax]MDA8453059.1 FAD-dependent oxidoreductase [Acidovorax sp. GBBC 3297]MDA8462466.1 FAD-dependent oxidoreductase [Acidovorax sp. GBBC 3333]MDA8467501.1 FAD-dependent oxidoreductase [Acidovorax sp. GBBC 3332]MDA8472535.1 FAD-dependent oxidoreductase [Acidovorax sp. GBBC 3299]WCM80346.1 FAD-dependent oxidoreductase [Acidovorax sp. GBBC 712]
MDYDLVVIGAGPAGMAAATKGAALGLKVLLLDEQAQAGGQIYRRVQEAGRQALHILGNDYAAGRELIDRLQASGADTCFGAFVVDVSPQWVVFFRVAGTICKVRARQLIVATGAMERASPFPGWTLPGVMPAGAAQIALKADAVVPSGRVAVAGCGPLFLLVSQQLLRAGVDVVALIETGEPGNARRALPHLPSALRSHRDLLKGMSMMGSLWRAGMPWFRGCDALQAIGDELVRGVRFRHRGKPKELAVDTLLVHHGVVPNHQLSRLLGLAHHWNSEQLAWQIECDPYGQTSTPGIFVAGDGASIAGAQAAAERGALAALGAARALGRLGPDELHRSAAAHVAQLRRHTGIRPFLDALYPPPEWLLEPADDTVVCRCERVSAGTVREMSDLGCAGPNQTKFMSRCGMGPCQGRMCGTPVTQLMAQRLGLPPDEVGAYRVRPPLKPLPLSVIAKFHHRAQP